MTLPTDVADEAARAARVLWRLSATETLPAHLAQFHRAFLEQYGMDNAVALSVVMDPERGLGPPAGYVVPPSERRLEPSAEPHSKGEELIAALVEAALIDGSNEVVLDDDLVDRLAGADADAAPESLELCVQVLAASATALDDGDFRLVVSPAVGSPTAGAIFGRFAYLFSDGACLASVAAGTADHDDGPLRAQLVFQPVDPRGGNVIQVPAFCAHTLAVGTFADRSQSTVLGLEDIAVAADHDRLYLMSVRHGREIVPISPHMLNVGNSSANTVRLIREITASRHREFGGWTWGRVGILPRLPRVRYGRTVLVPATWRVEPRLRDRKLSWPEWNRELSSWRTRWGVPERILVQIHDHRVPLELSSGLHRQLLRDELSRRPGAVVTEVIGAESDTGWLAGHANEVVIPLRSVGRPAHPPQADRTASSIGPVTASTQHLPGGDWLYAKLYCGRARHDEVLAAHIADLADGIPSEVDRWFFIRYADPDPHLRLRFHGEPTALYGRLLPTLHDLAGRLCAAGLANRLVLDTYRPEFARYGGVDALAAAERAFAADTAAVLTQLRLRARGLDLQPDLLAAANHVDLLRNFGDPDWQQWLLGEYPQGKHHASFRSIRREAVRLIDPIGDWPALSTVDGGADVLAAWHQRAAATAEYGARVRQLIADGRLAGDRSTLLSGLLHMHHNRLVGSDSNLEARSLAIARGAVQAHLDRARFGS